MVSFIDSLSLDPNADLTSLVGVLRAIHDARKSELGSPALKTPAGDARVDPVSYMVLDRIAQGSKDLTRWLADQSATKPPASDPAHFLYSTLRDRFDRIETDMREHAALVDRVLSSGEPTRPASPRSVPYQETLYLQCAQGARTAGRFRCVNHRNRSSAVHSKAKAVTRLGIPIEPAPILSVKPRDLVLDPGASAIFTVELDFGPCPDLKGDAVQTSVDLHVDEEIAIKVWLEVSVYERS